MVAIGPKSGINPDCKQINLITKRPAPSLNIYVIDITCGLQSSINES